MPVRGSVRHVCALLFCRLGVAGLSPVMPGTCGTLLAACIAPVLYVPLPLWGRALLLAGVFWLGALAAGYVERVTGRQDPGEVVIDELLGLWVVLLPFAEPSWQVMVAAVVLFRIFDMAKPWPVSASEHWLPNGYGVMIDDVVAGLLALGVMGIGVWFGWL